MRWSAAIATGSALTRTSRPIDETAAGERSETCGAENTPLEIPRQERIFTVS
jgi:hypothetical protein